MLGLIVVAPENGQGLSPDALLEPLLGVPLLSRAIGGALPTSEPVYAVLVVPADLVERVRVEAVERFGLDEVEQVCAGGPDLIGALRAGLEALPPEVERVLVQLASRVLAPLELCDRVLAALPDEGAAAPAAAVSGLAVAEEDGRLSPLEIRPRIKLLQGPQAFTRGCLARVLEDQCGDDPAESAALAGVHVALVEGDPDNLLLAVPADVSRAVEVFSRRAVDYAFLYPRDLLPEDPLKRALGPGEPIGAAEEPSSDDEGTLGMDATQRVAPAPGTVDSL
jgi:2-C-methyl-D-erythritol 4-phosphate cytidylyltransferase